MSGVGRVMKGRVMKGLGSGIAVVLVAFVFAAAAVVEEAEARRLGGGKSFGRQSQNLQRQQQAQPPAKDTAGQATQPAAPAGAAGSRWGGPLAGLAAGLGIFALLSAFGLTGALAEMLGSLLMIGLLVFAGLFIWRMLRGSRSQMPAQRGREPAVELPGAASARVSYQDGGRVRPGSVLDTLGGGAARLPEASTASTDVPTSTSTWGVPADFDVDGFVRTAKVHFIRLQAAWDAHDLGDIREFTTPEVFAELRMQMGEAPGATEHTEVLSLEARLLGIEESASDFVASVRFDGTIREGEGAVEPFSEVWNLSKPKRGNRGWLLAGVQQLQ
jgi:predicted lipid-binding transport protein (Tim44 family)